MATTYNLVLADGTSKTYARKDAAVKNGDKADQPFQVLTVPGGKVVHESDPVVEITPGGTQTAEQQAAATASDVEATSPANPEKESNMSTKTTEVPFTHGARYFFQPMGAGAVALAESAGLTATLQGGAKPTIVIEGGDAKSRRSIAKAIDSFLTAEYVAFKEWKKEPEVWAQRKEWRKADDHAAINDAEVAWFEKYVAENVL